MGGAIYTSHNTVLTFTGTSNFTATMYVVYVVLVVQFTHMAMLYLPLMEPTTSSTTQQMDTLVMVVQSAQAMQYLPSLEPTTLSTTQQMEPLVMVVQSTLHLLVMLYLFSMEPTTSSTTQQFIMVVQSTCLPLH